MKSVRVLILSCLASALCSGCLTWTPSAQDAASAVALVAPQYAGQASAVASVIGTKAKSKSAKSGSVSLDGFAPARIYRVRGVITEAKDISWTDIWSREGNAATDDISAPPIVEAQREHSIIRNLNLRRAVCRRGHGYAVEEHAGDAV